MELQSIVAKLHPLERAVLPVLPHEKSVAGIARIAKLSETEVMRALQWLENKNALTISSSKQKIVVLEKNGLLYKQTGLPEMLFLRALDESWKSLPVITKKSKLSREEVTACLGLLKQKKAIAVKKEEEQLLISLTEEGKKYREQKSLAETILNKRFPVEFSSLTAEERAVVEDLQKRKGILRTEEQKEWSILLTELGKLLAVQKLEGEVVNRLTPSMLKTGAWKDKVFRAYDVEINVPAKHRGRKHFMNEAVEYVKRIWLDMGFKEITGNYVHSAFWDLDALFVPQDHPAREMQDTFYIEGKAKLPSGIVKKVREAHEHGAETGSRGWRCRYSEEEAEKILLRTHTTVLSAMTLSTLRKEDLPAKFFMVGKVFRNEALDWKHLFEFYQVDGIVVDPDANLKHLKGYLTEFYRKMGYSKVRMRPAHFPYTEPSLEVDVFHPTKKEWIELGGAGIFRPEVVKPLLGFDCPVLAWGQGMGRIVSEYWKITDIRDLYKNDIKQLREMKSWMR